MIRLLILYGQPKDPEAFLKYYNEVHIPIAKKMKGLKGWTIGKVIGTPDNQPTPYFYVADLVADSRSAMEAILESPEGRAAVNDVPNFASGGVTFVYTDFERVI
jgi:uncharacterized protein (TIGR02118 family)